ncbi:MAG: hypothetical protein AAF602_12680 [Myxococcota bacterium]
MTLVLLTLAAHAWDTQRNAELDWRSLYPDQIRDPEHNEHANMTQDILGIIDRTVQDRFGTGAPPQMLVDLHASWLRDGELGDVTRGDDPLTPVEERELPPIAMFAGLPDVAYSLPDWIQKRSVCPPIPGNDPLCYGYGAWLGAGLNSTHFGALATKVYGRHHAQARHEADRADDLRRRLEAHPDGLPDGLRFHAASVREAETLAMTLEMTGQHFMQDRWSSGHMWSRWGSGEVGGRTLQQAQLQGLVTSLFHGSKAVLDYPDPMCTPDIESQETMTWRYASSPVEYEGVGDEILDTL